MKRLFQVVDTAKGRKVVKDSFAEDKQKAKALRDELNGDSDTFRFVVSPGPDHHRYAG